MWFFPTKKEIKKEFEKISRAFKKRDSDIQEIRKEIISKKEVELMIKEEILKIKADMFKVREIGSRTPRTAIRKKADKMLDKAEILSEMANLSKKGYSTTEMFNIIVNEKQLCKKTCFYKYMKKVREQFAEVRGQHNAN